MSKNQATWELVAIDKISPTLKKLQGRMDNIRQKTGGLLGKFRGAFGKMGSAVRNMFGKMGRAGRKAFGDLGSGLKGVAMEIPVLGKALTLLSSPIGMVAAAIGAVVAGLVKSVKAASAFEDAFLPIQQLNMDKPRDELEKYRGQILRASDATGVANTEMAAAFYDLQSATGLYGDDVEKMVTRIGQFSFATGADLTQSVNSAAKAINAWGLTVDDMDGFMKANIATVQLGVTTFDELATNQVEYAGAAASANQSVVEANKLFAAFTAASKDSATAATMTKTAFQGMTQGSFIKNMEKIGVAVFDAQGKMRGMSEIVTDLQPKISKMNDVQFAKLRNEIGGPEGLQNMLNTVRSQGETLVDTFQKFDKSVESADINALIETANGNVSKLWQMVTNKLNNAMTRIGRKILPYIIKALHWVQGIMDRVSDKTSKTGGFFANIVKIAKRWWKNLQPIFQVIQRIAGIVWDITSALFEWVANSEIMSGVFDAMGWVIERVADFVNIVIDTWIWQFNKVKEIAQWVSRKVNELTNGISNFANKVTFGLLGTSNEERVRNEQAEAMRKQQADAMRKQQADAQVMALGEQFFNANQTEQQKALQKLQNSVDQNISHMATKLLGADTRITMDNVQSLLNAQGGSGDPNAPEAAKMPGTKGFFSKRDKSKKDSDRMTSIMGGGKQVKNINIKIDKLIEKVIYEMGGNAREDDRNLENRIKTLLLRAINDTELSAE